jgi:hypothetical protein
MKLNLLFSLVTCTFGVLSKNITNGHDFTPLYFPLGAIILVLTLKSILHFELIFCEV